jgi:hypothetical protein
VPSPALEQAAGGRGGGEECFECRGNEEEEDGKEKHTEDGSRW